MNGTPLGGAPAGVRGTAPTTSPLVELRGVWKRYGSVVANADVDLVVRPGTVHAVLGENGAGKSTLMRVLFGVEQPDAGELLVHGRATRFRSPRDAIDAGIGMVFQHFGLVRELTALDNVALGAETRRGAVIDRRAQRRRLEEVSRTFGLSVPFDARVGDLSVAQQQRVEILKALYRGASLLVLDEPTALLAPQERTALFEAVRRLQDDGLSVVFITHKLDEADTLADDVTVMRAGRVVSTGPMHARPRPELITDMLGSRPAVAQYASRPHGATVLHLDQVTTRGQGSRPGLQPTTLSVAAGEIVGVVGIDGNGQQELCHLVAGTTEPASGTLHLHGPRGDHSVGAAAGRRARRWDRRTAARAGVAYVPGDRLASGVATGHDITDNLIANRVGERRFARLGLLRHATAAAHAQALVERFDIRCSGVDQPTGSLSGGNIQKVVLARELSVDPDVVVVCEPTRGLDIGAIANVHEQLLAAAGRGAAVVVQSSDLDEVLALCDRILVLREHRVVADLPVTDDLAALTIGSLMLGTSTPGPDAPRPTAGGDPVDELPVEGYAGRGSTTTSKETSR